MPSSPRPRRSDRPPESWLTGSALSQDWLNDGAKAFMPGEDPNRITVFEGTSLQVAAASPRYLLAMKLLAARVERDQDDIRDLYRLCGFSTAAEGTALLEATYPEHAIPPRARLMLEEMFPAKEISQNLDHEKGRDAGLDIGL
jgi:hypothetical protein